MDIVVSGEDEHHVISQERGHRAFLAHSMLDGDVLMAVEYLDFPECAIAGCEM